MWEALQIILAVGVLLALVVVVAACVCGCRKDTHKSELVGTAGVVKLRIEEETQPVAQTTPLSGKRVSSQNSHRSLPEIPPSVPRQDSGDTASELYATVETNQRIPEQCSPSAARRSDHPYEHAYARLQDGHRVEEAAIENENLVGSSSGTLPLLSVTDDSQLNNEGAVVITASIAISGQVSSSRDLPYMTPPVVSIAAQSNNPEEATARQPNQHFSGDSVDSTKGYTSISVREPLSSIRTNMPVAPSQPHYATVSDDSDEMYAAIDEPASGSETYAQIQPANVQPTQPPTLDASSANVGRLSNSNINTIPEASATSQLSNGIESNSKRMNGESTSNHVSHKHTRQSSNSSYTESVGNLGSPKPEKRQANSPLPPPPSTSVSETTSTTAASHKKNQDSPVHHVKSSKHHKISSTGNLHDNDKLRRSLNEKHQRNNSCVSSSDFYGCNYPVDKHRFSSGDLVRPLVAKELNFSFDKPSDPKTSDAIYNTIDGPNDIYAAIDQEPPRKSLTVSQPNVTGSPIKNVEEMYAKVIKKSKQAAGHSTPDHRSQPSSRLSNYEDMGSSRNSDHTSNSTNVTSRKKSIQHDEDRLSWSNENKRYSGSSSSSNQHDSNTKSSSSMKMLNVQMLNKDDPGYETIDRMRKKSHGYETIEKNVTAHKPERSADPGYETVKESNKNVENNQKHKVIPTVSGGLTNPLNSVDILQRSIHDGRASPINEPGYETVPSGPDSLLSNDPGYEHIHRQERYASDSDPNYEVLRSRNSTPPYSSIRNKSQNNVPGYSIINKKPKVPDHNWMSNNNENFSSEPNYESMTHETYNTGSESDPNYESVGPKDPNYESVKYADGSTRDPPYERVKSESVSTSNNAFQRTNSSTSYEKVKSILKHDRHNDDKNDNRANGSSLSYAAEPAPVADYFQV